MVKVIFKTACQAIIAQFFFFFKSRLLFLNVEHNCRFSEIRNTCTGPSLEYRLASFTSNCYINIVFLHNPFKQKSARIKANNV